MTTTYAKWCQVCERQLIEERRRRRNGRIAETVLVWTLRLIVAAVLIGPIVVSML